MICNLSFSDIPRAQITVVTYGLLRNPNCHVVREALYNQEFKVVIADESHYMKNQKSATSKYLVPLLQNAIHKVLLTGTPALARPAEVSNPGNICIELCVILYCHGHMHITICTYCDRCWRVPCSCV